MLSPLGKACARMDLTAVHEILLKTGYKDDEGAENEVSEWSLLTPILHTSDRVLVQIENVDTQVNPLVLIRLSWSVWGT